MSDERSCANCKWNDGDDCKDPTPAALIREGAADEPCPGWKHMRGEYEASDEGEWE